MMNNSEPTEHEKQIVRVLEKCLYVLQCSNNCTSCGDLINEVKTAITAAKQEQSEDVARLDEYEIDALVEAICQPYGNDTTIERHRVRKIIERCNDAARGVQPAVKYSPFSDPVELHESIAGGIVGSSNQPTAKQASAPTHEQQTETGGKWTEEYVKALLLTCFDFNESAKTIAEKVNAALAAKDEHLRSLTEMRNNWQERADDTHRENNALREQLRVMREAAQQLCNNLDADAERHGRPKHAHNWTVYGVEMRKFFASAPAAPKQESAE